MYQNVIHILLTLLTNIMSAVLNIQNAVNCKTNFINKTKIVVNASLIAQHK